MADPPSMELEAATYLHKLINESKDEPINLGKKLYRILQHMRSSGKENSIPYHVISRGLETVIKQHNLDIGTLISSCTGILIRDSTSSQLAGSSKQVDFNKDLKSNFDGNEMSAFETCASTRVQNYPGTGGPDIYQGSTDIIAESAKMQHNTSRFEDHDFSAKMCYDMSIGNFPAATFGDHFSGRTIIGKTSDHVGSSMSMNPNKVCFSSSVPGVNMTRITRFGDTGNTFVPQGSNADLPFTRQQLNQLRAQCLVHIAFSKCMRPTKLQLDVALGNISAKDEPYRGLIDQKGKELIVNELSSASQFISQQAPAFEEPYISGTWSRSHWDDMGNRQKPENLAGAVRDMFEQSMLETSCGSGYLLENEPNVSLPSTFVVPEIVIQRKDDATSLSQTITDWNSLGNQHCDTKLPCFKLKGQLQPETIHQYNLALPVKDSDLIVKNVSHVLEADQEDVEASTSTDRHPLPKYTTIENWILNCQKRKFQIEQDWERKKQITEQRIATRIAELKESINSAEDSSAKTKNIIELKKLQLVGYQRRLRRNILDDFYRPVDNLLDKLKSIKKTKIGRRSKQNEKYEQKMEEERQKRDRERQNKFFSDLEVHRGRMEDGLKIKRECSKGFNKYVKEFHTKKEKFHREKIDRIHQEKINLLKINDVEGYLRMVEGAKSDRVSQLLKQTEEYMHKLGSKLKEAKSVARQFENDMEESNMKLNELATESADEKDQAQHYLESNEKYYLMAHSVKENIMEQPTSLKDGKLREYQMNGLRWLVSLYNNNLNGILADEMGLGKTIQVISLICYLMETKKDRGPFLVVVPSSVLSGWELEIERWAPSIKKIVYTGSPEDRRTLFKEQIAPHKFNVLLTTYEYMMNKHDRPKLSKVQWHYIIIDEGHRIKNASCKLNADLKQYRSNHRLLLTGTPLQNNIEELWSLLNFLLPNIFNSSENFSQWFNKPFKGNGENSSDEALLSEEENLLIINRLHQVLRPFVLRRLKHKVENELPEKIERLIRCEASAYQKLLMKRVEDNLGAIGTSKARSVHNSVMELRNICNHPYLSQLHVDEVHELIPKHFLPNNVRLCGKLEMLDRLLPKLKATDHRVLLFSTMTRLLDVLEDYLSWKKYRYLRLDGQTSGGDRGALIEQFNQPSSPFFIFLLSIRAGGVGVNLQAADTVIIFDTDWNPQIDLQAQARAHRIGQKKEVLVLRLETVQTVEEQVRASAEHKLRVANQSITAGFFDNNTSAEDRREYLESLLREGKKEEVAPVLDDDSLNYTIARSELEIQIFESVDKQRRSDEMVTWENMFSGKGSEIPPLPSRLLTDDDLKSFYEIMKISEAPTLGVIPNAGMKRKRSDLGDLDTQEYGRGKRTKEVRTYEDDWAEEDFERICSDDSPQSPVINEKSVGNSLPVAANDSVGFVGPIQTAAVSQLTQLPAVNPLAPQNIETTQPIKRGRGRPKKVDSLKSPAKKEEIVRNTSPVAANDSVGLPQIPSVNPPALQNTEAKPPIKRGRGRPKKVDSTETLVKSEKIIGKPLQVTDNESVVYTGFQISEATPPIKRGRGRPKKVVGASPVVPCPAPSATRNEETSQVETYVVPSPKLMEEPIISPRGRGRGRKSNSGGEASAPRCRGKKQLMESQAVPCDTDTQTTGPQSGINCIPTVAPITGSPSAPPHADLGSQGPVPSSSLSRDSSDQLVVSDSTLSASIPQDTPPVVSHAPFTQSFILSLSAIKQGRGEGLNTEICEKTPHQKHRRQENEISVASGSYNDQDSASTEPPHKRTRASVGETATTGDEKDQALADADPYATQDAADPSAERFFPTEIAEDKSEDLPHEQYPKEPAKENSNEVLPSKSQLGVGLPTTSTLDTVARALSPPVSEPGSQPDQEYAAQHENEPSDNEGSPGDNSLISKPEVSSVFTNLEISQDSLTLAVLSSISVEMGKDYESLSKKDGDEITESAENPNILSKEATNVVLEMMKDSFNDESGKVLTSEPKNNTIVIEIPVSAAEVIYPEIPEDKFEIPPQEQYPNVQEAKENANEVCPWTSQLGDSLPSISTSDPVAESLTPPVSESGSQLAIDFAAQHDNKESENKGPREDSSFALMTDLSTTVNNLGISENSVFLPVFSSISVETEKDCEFPIEKQSDEMTEPAKMPNPNNSVTLVKLFEGATKSVSETIIDSSSDESAKLLVGELENNAVLIGVSVSAAEVTYPESEPARDTLNQLHEVETLEEQEIKISISDFDCETEPNISDGSFPTFSTSFAVDSIGDMSEYLGDGNEGEKMVESMKTSNLEESLASGNLSGETLNAIPEFLEENTAYQVSILSTEVAFPALESSEDKTSLYEEEVPGEQDRNVGIKHQDLDTA